MSVGIIGAMDPEVETLISKLENHTVENGGIAEFHHGVLNGHTVVITRCGIGKVCAAAVTALLIKMCRVDCIINTGCAGGIGEGLKIGDTVFSTKAAHHDADLTAFGYKKGQMAGHELYFNADPMLMAKADIAAGNIPEFKGHIRKGLVVSGDQFINTPEKRASILKDFPDALVSEMEGSSIAQVASDFKIPFLIIRAVSDNGNEGTTMTYDEFMPIAAANSAKLVQAILSLL